MHVKTLNPRDVDRLSNHAAATPDRELVAFERHDELRGVSIDQHGNGVMGAGAKRASQ
jgi:hypothetical protein